MNGAAGGNTPHDLAHMFFNMAAASSSEKQPFALMTSRSITGNSSSSNGSASSASSSRMRWGWTDLSECAELDE